MRPNRWHFLFLTLLIGGSAWVWISRVPATALTLERSPQPAIGYPAPDFTQTTLAGETISLAGLRGTPVVLNFWATWCDPCRREMPALQATAEQFDGQVLILGIDQGEAAPTVAAFIEEYGLTYPILLDEAFTVGDLYNVRGMPTTFFIDGDGIIRHLWVGEMNRITLAEGIALIR
jgi:cytochrome c biogenesis protein CcmG, thiol:disulfide interchange protein DsbE